MHGTITRPKALEILAMVNETASKYTSAKDLEEYRKAVIAAFDNDTDEIDVCVMFDNIDNFVFADKNDKNLTP